MNFRPMPRILALLLLCGAFIPSAVADDALPTFSIAYFNGPCPEGWDNTSLASASGRSLLPTPRGGGAGGFIGEPLASQQAPSHEHAKATGSITSPAKQFVLINGCCNGSLGHSGTYPMNGSAQTGNSGLPYIQYNACVKTAPPNQETAPSGLLTFSLVPCSGIFSEYTAASGRYIVGLNPNGQPAATFGGTNLQPSEIRHHSHMMNGSLSFPSKDIAGASGCCAHNYAASGTYSFTGTTEVDINSSKFDSAVQAPYYTAFLCEVR